MNKKPMKHTNANKWTITVHCIIINRFSGTLQAPPTTHKCKIPSEGVDKDFTSNTSFYLLLK